MKKNAKVSVIYVHYNTPKDIEESILSLLVALRGIPHEVIVVDNDSEKKLTKKISNSRNVTVIRNAKNIGFGAACNLGADKASGKFLLFLNPDTTVAVDAVSEMLKTFSKKKIGIVGPKMVNLRNEQQPTISSFITFPQNLVVYSFLNNFLKQTSIVRKFWLMDSDKNKMQTVDVLSGACIMVRKEIFDRVGGFDEQFFMYFEEQDLCRRVYEMGYKAVFNPKALIMHRIGRSLSDKQKIKGYFQKSRYLYIKKYFGWKRAIFSEFFLQSFTATNLFILFIFALSLFINEYRQNTLMLFIGDAARDFIAARDMLLKGAIPLVGIPSSVPWLHQGPISVYGIGLSFVFSNFNPIAPGVFFGFIGSLTTVLLFVLGKRYFSYSTAVISTLFYAVSPMVVVNARMPYHTSLIPFFTVIFFLSLFKAIKRPKLFPLVFLCFGLLLQVELSNIIVLAIVMLVILRNKIKLTKKIVSYSIFGFVVGVLPFILYEFTNGPSYIKFPLWILNRIRLFFGLTLHHNSTTSSLPAAFQTIYQQISGVIFPQVAVIGITLFLIAVLFLLLKGTSLLRNKNEFILAMWILIPLFSFFLHAAPGTAYFGLVYPAIALLIGILFEALTKKNKLFFLVFVVLIAANLSALLTNDFFVTTSKGAHPMPPTMYNFGSSYLLSDKVSRIIANDAKNQPFRLNGGGTLTMYRTSIDPYIFLTWYHGGHVAEKAHLLYVVYQDKSSIPKNTKLIYQGSEGSVAKYE